METVLYILIALTAWHYLWDGILAPSFRAGFRFDLFALRDRVRDLRASEAISADQFRLIEDSVNSAIQGVSLIDLSTIIAIERAFNNDEELRLRVRKRVAFLESAPNEISLIYHDASSIVYRAFLVNIGAWLIPLVAVYAPIRWAVEIVSQTVSLTENELRGLLPEAPVPSILSA